jgi:hypothetical protein
VRVLNASDVAGRAQQVADALSARGFVIAEVGNDGTSRKAQVTGPGEVRHGPLGEDAARFLSLQHAQLTLFQDTRATATVDMVIGPEWGDLAAPEAIAEQLAAQPTEAVGC